jgi:hypothetical protein
MRRTEDVSEAYYAATADGSPEELHSLQMAMQAGSAFSATIEANLNEILQMEQLLDSGDFTPHTIRHGVELLSDMTMHIEQFIRRIRVHQEQAQAARSTGLRSRPVEIGAWLERGPSSRLHSTSYLHPLAVPTPPPAQTSAGQAGGLGDRTRSASPEHEAAAWDTMQITIEPDANLPSADSSFTSAAASASFSATTDNASPLGSGSRGSSSTNLTVPSNDENPCDDEPFILWADQIPPREPARYNDRHIDALRDRYPRAPLSAPSDPAPPFPLTRTYAGGRTILGPDGNPASVGRSHLGHIPRSQSPMSLLGSAPGGRSRARSIDWGNPGEPASRRPLAAPERARRVAQSPREQAAPARRYSRVGRSRRRDTQSPTDQQGPPSRDPLAHPDLVIMRDTLMHMADGGEIPPHAFWASAGLTPIIAQGGELSGIRLLGDAMESSSD